MEGAARDPGTTLAFGVSAGGGEIHLRLSEPGLAHRVSALFPDYRKERLDDGECAFRAELLAPDGDGNRLLRAPGRLLGTPRADGSEREEDDMEGMGRVAVRGDTEALAVLEAVLARGLLHLDSGRVHLHAAGVEVGGRGLVALGPSGSGKSSLALACALDGHRLLGDDVVGIDASGSAWPFRRLVKVDAARLRAVGTSPTSTVAWSEGSAEAWFDPRAAGGWSAGGVSVRAVVLLERRKPGNVAAHADEACGPDAAQLSRMHPAEALNVLLASIMPTGHSAEESVDPLLALLDVCRAYHLSFRSTRRAASLLVDLLEGGPAGGANPEPREDP